MKLKELYLGQAVIYGNCPVVVVDIDYDEKDVKVADDEIDCGQWVKPKELKKEI